MTTRDISFPDGRPVTDKPDALPGRSPAAAPKSKKEFAAVIEQAMRRRPASVRSGRPASPQRDDAPAASPARANAVRLPKPGTSRPAQSEATRPPVDPSSENPRRADDSGIDPLAGATDGEEAAAPDDSASSESGSKAGASPDGLPQNIVLFPTPSVIIPFPLEEAKAMRGSARAVESSLLGRSCR